MLRKSGTGSAWKWLAGWGSASKSKSGSVLSSSWKLDLQHSEKPDPDPQQSKKLDPDPHKSKKPDPHPNPHQSEKPGTVNSEHWQWSSEGSPWRASVERIWILNKVMRIYRRWKIGSGSASMWCAVLWDLDSLNPDPDWNPAFQVNPDIRIQIQGFDDQKMKKKKTQLKENLYFVVKNCLQPSKENIRHFER